MQKEFALLAATDRRSTTDSRSSASRKNRIEDITISYSTLCANERNFINRSEKGHDIITSESSLKKSDSQEKSDHMADYCTDPVRRMINMTNPARPPRRFFRTFWNSLVRRLLYAYAKETI